MIKLNPIDITPTSQSYAVEVTERLCKPFCENASIQPSVVGRVVVDDVKLVGDIEYVRVKAQGTITYVAKNASPCCPCQKVVTEYFTVAFAGVTELKAPTINVVEGYVEPAYVNCYNVACGISFVGNIVVKIPA